jgi:uncharacterized protein YdaL
VSNLITRLLKKSIILSLAGASVITLGALRLRGENLAPRGALILYDAPADEPKLGLAYAIMLQALLGHFDIEAKLEPVADYQAGQTETYANIFYLGSHYNHPLSDDFLRDVSNTQQRVVWFKYNLWQLSSPRELQFEAKSGIRFQELHGLDAVPTRDMPNPGFYNTVLYKGKALTKYYQFNANANEVQADPDVGIVTLSDPSKAQAKVMIQDSRTGATTPYIVQAGASGNFWYFADLPFSYIGPRDRYLVLCDILHDILGIQHEENHRALVRLEDVNAKVDFESIKTLSDFLYSRHIPFSVATIPHYKDPLGANSNGTAESIPFYQATELQKSLIYAYQHGGNLVMHGYTHQYSNIKNPHSGVSADDYEFWNAAQNSPVKEDSENWAMQRLNQGIKEFAVARFRPWAWETPHYQGSPQTYRAMSKRFNTTYQRMVYYTSEKPNLNTESVRKDYAAGMFFPYIIHRDPYGQYVIPENLGNIEYDIHETDPSSNFNYTWKDILTNAEYALVVRDGFGSFFFHPFWVDSDFAELHAMDDFKNLIDGITSLGYQWADPKSFRNGASPRP